MKDRKAREIGVRIMLLRDKRRYTRRELAEMTGLSQRFLCDIENGQKGFSARSLYRIATALEVSCDYILTGEDCVSRL